MIQFIFLFDIIYFNSYLSRFFGVSFRNISCRDVCPLLDFVVSSLI